MIGVGTDLVEVDQLRRALTRTPGLKDRIFTEGEWDYAHRHSDPIPHLAARFAAKEATMKSLGLGMSKMGFREIEVVRDDDGRPSIRLAGRAESAAMNAGASRFELSLTHTPSMAHAIVVAL